MLLRRSAFACSIKLTREPHVNPSRKLRSVSQAFSPHLTLIVSAIVGIAASFLIDFTASFLVSASFLWFIFPWGFLRCWRTASGFALAAFAA
jgi:hypothetical protein